jgi:MFS family permease
MYPSIRPMAAVESAPPPEETVRDGPAISANIVYLGFTSFFTDISSEAVNAIIPIYLLFQLRFSYLQIGLFNGLYLGINGLMSVASAVFSDRHRRYKEIAGAGYGTSAACKLGLVAARNAPWPASTILFIDRVGKGVRTSPRDALISLSAQPRRLASAFGVHRAFDTAGAVLGPFVAFLILRSAPNAYDTVFVISFLFALLGLGVLVLFVQNRRDTDRHEVASFRSAIGLLRRPEFRALAVAGSILGLFTIADASIYLTVQQRTSFDSAYFPLLYVGMNISYLLLAIPMGLLADRVGRSRVFLGGFVLLFGLYLVLLRPSLSPIDVLATIALLGAFYACTDGVLNAMASVASPEGLRTSGLAVLTTATAISALCSGIMWGLFAEWWGVVTTAKAFAVVLAVSIVVSAFVLQVRRRRYG